MPYYIGDVIKDEKNLIARTPEKFRETGIDVRIDTRVEEIDEKAGGSDCPTVRHSPMTSSSSGRERSLFAGISGGGPGRGLYAEEPYRCPRIKAWIRDLPCRKAIIVGAGFIAMEMSEAIRNLGMETQIFHRGTLPVNRWDPEFGKLILAELERHEVGFVTDVEARAVERGKKYRLRLITDRGRMRRI